jgi:hypothetical protein
MSLDTCILVAEGGSHTQDQGGSCKQVSVTSVHWDHDA